MLVGVALIYFSKKLFTKARKYIGIIQSSKYCKIDRIAKPASENMLEHLQYYFQSLAFLYVGHGDYRLLGIFDGSDRKLIDRVIDNMELFADVALCLTYF